MSKIFNTRGFMKKILLVLSIIYLISCSADVTKQKSAAEIKYHVDVTNHEDDLFHITVLTSNLSEENNIYHMPSTVPGTYQVMDFGRFVHDIKAFDISGKEIELKKISDNSWEILNPTQLAKITYKSEDTFDAEVEDRPVAPMSGSGIEDNFISMNTFAVLGYFEGLQGHEAKIKVDYKSYWELGTALEMDSDGYYRADNYDHLADSPFLIGQLTVADTYVGDINVELYVWSPDTAITAAKIMNLADDVLQSAKGFIGEAPVGEYKFLMALISNETMGRNNLFGAGALEHSYSSLYVMPTSAQSLPGLRSTMAHEFLHILTPLFLHSEIIHQFDFINPTPSQHIWLYEGVTEWASDIMQLRGDVISIEDYFDQVGQKMRMNEMFNQELSLVDLALRSYGEDGYSQFLNFYQKGALTAMCLDLKLLELSNGKKGLRETFLQLLKEYGKYRPFPEDEFFDVIVDRTYPEIEEFINDYIKGTKPLPIREYAEKLGMEYTAEKLNENAPPTFGSQIGLNEDGKFIVVSVREEAKEFGFMKDDLILKLDGEELDMGNIQQKVQEKFAEGVGASYTMTLARNGEEVEVNGKLLVRKTKHIFTASENLTEEQEKLREVWSKNL